VIVARDYRNRRIVDFLKELDLTEGRGTGFPKMNKKMDETMAPLNQSSKRTNWVCILW